MPAMTCSAAMPSHKLIFKGSGPCILTILSPSYIKLWRIVVQATLPHVKKKLACTVNWFELKRKFSQFVLFSQIWAHILTADVSGVVS